METKTNKRQMALWAGISSVVMVLAAVVAEMMMRQELIADGQAAVKMPEHTTLFRLGVCGYLLILVCDMIAAWAFYNFFKETNYQFSKLCAWFRLVYTAVFAMALLNLVSGFRLLTDTGHTSFMQEQALHLFKAFEDGWAIGFVFFACHLLLLGWLSVKSGYVPRVFGFILVVAGLAYLTDNVSKLLLPGYDQYQHVFTVVVALSSIAGELGLAVWLLVRGGK